MDNEIKYDRKHTVRLTLIYFLSAVVWIVLTGLILYSLTLPSHIEDIVEISKGIVFVILTTVLVYILLKRVSKKHENLEAQLTDVINEQKKSEKSLKLFRSLIDNSNEAIEVIDPVSLQYLDVNKKSCSDLGYSREELLTLTIFDIDPNVTPSSYTGAEEMKNTVYTMFQSIHKRKDGSLFPVEVNVKYISLDREYLVAVARDITERKQAEETIKQAEERLRIFIENVDDMVYFQNLDGKLSMLNDVSTFITGYSQEEFASDPMLWEKIIHPDDIRIAREFFAKYPNGTSYFEAEYRLRRKDGQWRWLHSRMTGATDSSGRYMGYNCIDRDITVHKQMEDELRKGEEKYRQFFEDDLSGDFISTVDGTILICNKAFARIMGYDSVEEIMKVSSDEFYNSKADRESFLNLLREKKKLEMYEQELHTRDGAKLTVIENVIGEFNEQNELIRIKGYLFDITERKLAEEALRKQKNLLASIIENEPECVKVVDSNGDLIEMNPAGLRMLEVETIEEAKRYNLMNFLMPEYRESFMKLHQNVMQGGSEILEFEIQGKRGTHRWLESHAVPLRDTEGKITSMLSISRDITIRKQNEEAVHISEQKYRTIFDSAPIGIYQSTLEGRIITANNTLVRMLGYDSVEELLEKDLAEDIYYEKGKREELIRKYEPIGFVKDLEVKLKKKDGTPIWIQLNSLIVRDDSGALKYFEGYVHDITERKQKEEQITLLAHTMESISEIATITDSEDRLTFVNKSFLDKYGYSKEEVLGKHISILSPASIHSEILPVIHNETLKAGWKGEFINITKEGKEFPIFLATSVIKDETGKVLGLVGIAEDITERKQTEYTIRESEYWLRESQRIGRIGSYSLDIPADRWTSSEVLDEIFGIRNDAEKTLKSWNVLIHPDSREEMIEYFLNHVIKEKNKFDKEYKIVRANDGAVRWLWGLGEVTYDSNGNAVKMIGTIQDITERKQSENQIFEFSMFNTHILNSLNSHICVIDGNGVIVAVNHAWERFAKENGVKPSSVGKGANYVNVCANSVKDDPVAYQILSALQRVILGELNNFSLDYPCHSPTEQRWFTLNFTRFNLKDSVRVVISHTNITERKLAEEQINQLNSLYKAHSSANSLVLNINDRESLLKEFCRIVVVEAGFELAWIGFPDEKNAFLVPQSYYGDKSEIFLKDFQIPLNIPTVESSLTLKAFREQRFTYCNDFGNRQQLTKWDQKAYELGFNSFACFPIEIKNKAVGIFSVYSDKINWFGNDMISLLSKITEDISFALDYLKIQNEKNKLDGRYHSFIQSIPVGILLSQNGKIIFANPAMANILGMNYYDTLLGREIAEIFHDKNDLTDGKSISVFEKGISDGVEIFLNCEDGTLVEVNMAAIPYFSGDDVGMQFFFRDLTKERAAEVEILRKNEELRLLYESEKKLTSTLELDKIYDEIYKIISQIMSCDAMLISEYNKDEKLIHTKCIWAEKFKVDLSEVDLPPIPLAPKGMGIQSRVIYSGVSEIIENYEGLYKKTIHKHTFVDDKKAQGGKMYGSGLVVPMILTGEVIGTIQVYSFKKNDYSSEHLRLLESLASQISAASYNAKLYEQAQSEIAERERAQEKLHALAAHLQTVREEERKNLSREIHDQLGQELTVLKMDVSLLKKKINDNNIINNSGELIEQLDSMSNMVDYTINSVRRIAKDLRPDILDKLGLKEAIEWFCSEFEKRTSIKCKLIIWEDDIKFDSYFSLMIFRIVQESLTNVARHSRATQVIIQLVIQDKILNVKISDNGTGITHEQTEDTKSIGLIGLRERAYMLNGEVTILGEKDKGTELLFNIPLN